MFRCVFVLSVMLFLVVCVGNAGIAHAQPALTNCTTVCKSYSYWNGTVYGGYVITTVSDPGSYNTNAYWARYMRFGSGSPRLFIGEVKNFGNGAGSPYCNNGTHTVQYFVYLWDTNGNSIATDCFASYSTNYNDFFEIQAAPANSLECTGLSYPSTSYTYVQLHMQGSQNVDCVMDSGSTPNSYNRMEYDEELDDTLPTGAHQVWGVEWTDSKYAQVDGSFVYQHRAVDANSPHNPPQMYWHTIPNNTNNGGDMYSCDYASGSTCNIGS